MDCLHSPLAALGQPEDSKLLAGAHPLSVSSGNVQAVVAISTDGIENQYAFSLGDSDGRQPTQFPIPQMQLGSNDDLEHTLDRKPKRNPLKVHRPKIQIDHERPYLHHPKYLEYRSRPRQDIGKDGKPIWPDRIEAAFQNGMSVQFSKLV